MCQALLEACCVCRLMQLSSLLIQSFLLVFWSATKPQYASAVFSPSCFKYLNQHTHTNSENYLKSWKREKMIVKSIPPFSTEFSIVRFIL